MVDIPEHIISYTIQVERFFGWSFMLHVKGDRPKFAQKALAAVRKRYPNMTFRMYRTEMRRELV